MNEINEKLTEFAGFKESYRQEFYNKDKKAYKAWLYPGETEPKWTLPDFTNDLNACFKWLVPMANCDVAFNRIDTEGNWWCFIRVDCKTSYDAKAETPALAFCKAVEQLIEKHD